MHPELLTRNDRSHAWRKICLTSRRRVVGRLAFALIGASAVCSINAQPVAPVSVTQHSINDAAAGLERARRAVVEDTHLRLPGETLEAYVARIAVPLSNESSPHYKNRIGGYISVLNAVCIETAWLRRLPSLQDTSRENQKCWQRVTAGLNAFPTRLTTLKRAWKQTEDERQETRDNVHAAPPFALALTQTLRTIINASDALRDARP